MLHPVLYRHMMPEVNRQFARLAVEVWGTDPAGKSEEDLGVDPTGYDIVFIGYPIWWYEMPMIMDTFFETYDFSGVTIIPFNTHAGSRDGGTYGDIRELEPNATVLDGLAISGSDAGKDSARTSVEEWLEGLDLD